MIIRFVLNDITLLHKIFNNLITVKVPDYFSLFSGMTRLRLCHLDRLSYVSLYQVFFPGVEPAIHLGNHFSIVAIYFGMKFHL